jgi:hypothetical protein
VTLFRIGCSGMGSYAAVPLPTDTARREVRVEAMEEEGPNMLKSP